MCRSGGVVPYPLSFGFPFPLIFFDDTDSTRVKVVAGRDEGESDLVENVFVLGETEGVLEVKLGIFINYNGNVFLTRKLLIDIF